MPNMYMNLDGVSEPELNLSGGNISSNHQVSVLIPQPDCNMVERMCQRRLDIVKNIRSLSCVYIGRIHIYILCTYTICILFCCYLISRIVEKFCYVSYISISLRRGPNAYFAA